MTFRSQHNTRKLTTDLLPLPQKRQGEPESFLLWVLLCEGARICHCCYYCLIWEGGLGTVPCFLLSTEGDGVTENTSSPTKAASGQATFGNRCLAMISHLAPVLLKPVKAVVSPRRQPAVRLYRCTITGPLTSWSSSQTNSTADTEQGRAARRE